MLSELFAYKKINQKVQIQSDIQTKARLLAQLEHREILYTEV